MNKLKSSLKYFRLTLIFAEQSPLFSFCLVSILIGTFLSILFSKAPLQPFRKIMEATDKIAAGDYNVRIHLKGP